MNFLLEIRGAVNLKEDFKNIKVNRIYELLGEDRTLVEVVITSQSVLEDLVERLKDRIIALYTVRVTSR